MLAVPAREVAMEGCAEKSLAFHREAGPSEDKAILVCNFVSGPPCNGRMGAMVYNRREHAEKGMYYSQIMSSTCKLSKDCDRDFYGAAAIVGLNRFSSLVLKMLSLDCLL